MQPKTDKKVGERRRTAVLAVLVIVGGIVGVMSMPLLALAATPCITFQSDPVISYGACTSADNGAGGSSILSMSNPVSV